MNGIANKDLPVLVVEDNPDIREGLIALLQMEGFAVIAARHGQEALNMLRNGLRPCIIVMDLMMPVMNGFEFREAQLRDPLLSDIPVIACSGVSDPAHTARLRAKAFVQKPAEVSALVRLVRQHCLKSPGTQLQH